MSESGVKERRAHERHDTLLEMQGTSGAAGGMARMVARNLSAGGLYCTSSSDFPEMTRLAVRLLLPLGNGHAEPRIETVDLEAVVVRREALTRASGSERFDLALYFTSVSEPMRTLIRRFLDERD